jgi:hypothetical protein
VPKGAQYIALDPGGATAWVTSLDPGRLTPITLATRKTGRSIPIAGGPYAVIVLRVPQARHRPTPTPTTGKSKGKKPSSST